MLDFYFTRILSIQKGAAVFRKQWFVLVYPVCNAASEWTPSCCWMEDSESLVLTLLIRCWSMQWKNAGADANNQLLTTGVCIYQTCIKYWANEQVQVQVHNFQVQLGLQVLHSQVQYLKSVLKYSWSTRTDQVVCVKLSHNSVIIEMPNYNRSIWNHVKSQKNMHIICLLDPTKILLKTSTWSQVQVQYLRCKYNDEVQQVWYADKSRHIQLAISA